MLKPLRFLLGPIHVRWYGIILGTAALIGLMLAIKKENDSISCPTSSWIYC